MRVTTSGQQDVELGYGITLVIDFTAYGQVMGNFDGDPEAGYVRKFTEVNVYKIDIDDVTLQGRPDSHVALTDESITKLIEVIRPYAEELVEAEAT